MVIAVFVCRITSSSIYSKKKTLLIALENTRYPNVMLKLTLSGSFRYFLSVDVEKQSFSVCWGKFSTVVCSA